MNKFLLLISIALLGASCQETNKTQQTSTVAKKTVEVPVFSADSAYAYIEAQLRFGPRVPNTAAHDSCAAYLERKLTSFGASVKIQKANLKAFDGTILRAKNIIASFLPENKRRIALMAHWDTRPFADQCEDPERRNDPILGANDGASGVAVLLEIARHLGQKAPSIGIDIILFDAEDYGAPSWADTQGIEDWCLGSQYWAEQAVLDGYYAQYAILLDMVGAPGAQFTREAVSMHYAEHILDKVWSAAGALGYGSFFLYEKTPQIIDDHLFVNRITNIPTIDIIQHDPATKSFFGKYWHTHNDNLEAISRPTLKAVGQTVLHVSYNE